mgnify:CR=1 FL=1
MPGLLGTRPHIATHTLDTPARDRARKSTRTPHTVAHVPPPPQTNPHKRTHLPTPAHTYARATAGDRRGASRSGSSASSSGSSYKQPPPPPLADPDPAGHYSALGFDLARSRAPPPGDEDVRAAYRRLVMQLHPDRQAGKGAREQQKVGWLCTRAAGGCWGPACLSREGGLGAACLLAGAPCRRLLVRATAHKIPSYPRTLRPHALELANLGLTSDDPNLGRPSPGRRGIHARAEGLRGSEGSGDPAPVRQRRAGRAERGDVI